jgi:hypothetical protein
VQVSNLRPSACKNEPHLSKYLNEARVFSARLKFWAYGPLRITRIERTQCDRILALSWHRTLCVRGGDFGTHLALQIGAVEVNVLVEMATGATGSRKL